MRKIKDNQITIRMIEPKAIKKRLDYFNDRKIPQKTIDKVGKLLPWLESLENTSTNIRPLMNRIYNDLDYFMEKEIYPHSVCMKGCAHCCKVPVQVSLLEADYISQRAKIKIQHVEKNRYEMDQDVTGYCPLLDQATGTCSVYEFRPMACRIFATFDSWEMCERTDQRHYIHCFENQPLFKTMYDFLILHSKHAGTPLGLAAVAEIRDWFK